MNQFFKNLFVLMFLVALSGIPVRCFTATNSFQEKHLSCFPKQENKNNNHQNSIQNYQVSFGYWNDNFISIRNLEPLLNVGKDDNVTTSFWLQAAFESRDRWWLFNIYQSILTKKKQKYRTDLLSVYTAVEQPFERFKVTLGAGLIARGNYGGEFIQSGYHELRHFTPVNLPYKGNNSNGLLLLTGVDYRLLGEKQFIANGFVSNCLRTVPGPSSLRSGLKLDLTNDPQVHKYVFQIQLDVGYNKVYNLDEYVAPIFDSGLYQAALTSFSIIDGFLTSFWISRNQYGLKQTHFGITLTFGWDRTRMGNLEDVLYP